MKLETKNALESVTMVLVAGIIISIGIAIASVSNVIYGILISLGGLIPWGWACFANIDKYAS